MPELQSIQNIFTPETLESLTWLLRFLVVGAAAGFVGSLLGLGGGLITTPFITIFMGIDIKYAVAASALVVIANSTGSTINYLKENILNLRAAMFLEIFTATGALIGALITGIIAPALLYVLFSCLMLFSIGNMIHKLIAKNSEEPLPPKLSSKGAKKLKLPSHYYDRALKKDIAYGVKNVPTGSAIMFGAGIMSGMLGIGSGPFKVIAMDTAMKIPLKPSTSTSNLMMGVTACASAVVYFFNGMMIPEISAPIAIGVVAGAFIGTHVMPKIKPRILRIIFVPVMGYFAINMLLKAFGLS